MTTSLAPLPARRFGPREAWHLLARAGFPPAPHEVRDAVGQGLHATVDRLVDYRQTELDADLAPPSADPDVMSPVTPEERREFLRLRAEDPAAAREAAQRRRQAARRDDGQIIRDLQDWWARRMARTPRPMEEKLVLLWHGHFATRWRDVRDAYLMLQQHALFRRGADKSFAYLVQGIVRDPAMLVFLNNDRNVARRPNENLARELMELFTLGEGEYTEQDIREGARALTGYHRDDNDFSFNRGAHDPTDKRILGVRGDHDGDDFANLLLHRRACADFVALKLYRRFVADVPEYLRDVPSAERGVVRALAGQLRGDRYAFAPTLKTLLASQHFFSPGVMGRKIKDPADFVIGTARMLGAEGRGDRALFRAMDELGMTLFDPPSVAGWEGGRSWINTSTVFLRQNTATWLATGVSPTARNPTRGYRPIDPAPLLAGLTPDGASAAPPTKPAAVVDRLCDALLASPPAPERKAPLVAFLADRAGRNQPTRDDLVATVNLVTAMPEFQLC